MALSTPCPSTIASASQSLADPSAKAMPNTISPISRVRRSRQIPIDQRGPDAAGDRQGDTANAADRDPALETADTLLLVPDLVHYWLSGARTSEFTNATTTQCFDPRSGGFADKERQGPLCVRYAAE